LLPLWSELSKVLGLLNTQSGTTFLVTTCTVYLINGTFVKTTLVENKNNSRQSESVINRFQ